MSRTNVSLPAPTFKKDVNVSVRRWSAVLLLCLLGLLIRAICFTGLIGSDDLYYYHYAKLISQGLYSLDRHPPMTPVAPYYSMRYGLTVPVAFVYRIFGISEWTTEAIPYLASVASLLLVVVIGNRLFNYRTGLIAGLLYATFPLSIHFSTILVPEPVAQLYVLIAIALYLYTGRRYSLVLAAASGVFLALAYLSKEWSVFVVPAVLFDAAAKRQWRIGSLVALGAIATVGVEHLYYTAAAGDVVLRLRALKQTLTQPAALAESQNLAHRLFKTYPRMMLVPSREFGLHSLFALILIPPAVLTVSLGRLRLLILWVLIPLLYMNFGSLSFSNYMPVFSQPRYLEIIYPPLFLMAALVIERSAARRWRFAWLSALAVVALVGCYCGLVTRGLGFYTDHVTAIRNIVTEARTQHFKRICWDGTADEVAKWRSTMEILAPDIEGPRSGPCDIVVRPDARRIPTWCAVNACS